MARAPVLLSLLTSMLSYGSAYYIQSFPGFDIPGRDLVVSSFGGAEQQHQFVGFDPQACIDECVATASCHGVVTVGEKCWFRGGWLGPRGLDMSRVPASSEYTVHIIYDGLPIFTTGQSKYLWLGIGGALVLILCITACCCRGPPKPKVAFPTSVKIPLSKLTDAAQPPNKLPPDRVNALRKTYSFAKPNEMV